MGIYITVLSTKTGIVLAHRYLVYIMLHIKQYGTRNIVVKFVEHYPDHNNFDIGN